MNFQGTIHCKNCNQRMTWDEQKFYFKRLKLIGHTEAEIKAISPTCLKCGKKLLKVNSPPAA